MPNSKNNEDQKNICQYHEKNDHSNKSHCKNIIYKKTGVCRRHYFEYKEKNKTLITKKTCEHLNCNNIISINKSLCKEHSICIIEDCTNQQYSKKYCKKHYTEFNRSQRIRRINNSNRMDYNYNNKQIPHQFSFDPLNEINTIFIDDMLYEKIKNFRFKIPSKRRLLKIKDFD